MFIKARTVMSACVVLVCLSSSPVLAVDYTWTGAHNNSVFFGDLAWSPDASGSTPENPGAGDSVIFDLPGSSPLSLSGDVILTTGSMEIRQGSVSINQSSNSFTADSINVGTVANQTSDLTMYGSSTTLNSFNMGTAANTTNSATFIGFGTSLNTAAINLSQGNNNLSITNFATATNSGNTNVQSGTLSASYGSSITTNGTTTIGGAGQGTITADGVGTTLNFGDDITLNNGSLAVNNGATLSSADHQLHIDADDGKTNTFSVDAGSASFKEITLGKDFSGTAGNAELILRNGADVTAENFFVGNRTGDSTSISVLSGSTLTNTGSPSYFNASGNIRELGVKGSTGSITVSGVGSTYTETFPDLPETRGMLLGSGASISVTDGGHYDARYLQYEVGVSSIDEIAGSADINIADADSKMDLGRLIIGSTSSADVSISGSNAQLNIHDFASTANGNSFLTTATGELIVADGQNGSLTVAGGADLTVDGTTTIGGAGQGTITADGVGTTLNFGDDVSVQGGSMSVTNLAALNMAANTTLNIATDANATGTVTLDNGQNTHIDTINLGLNETADGALVIGVGSIITTDSLIAGVDGYTGSDILATVDVNGQLDVNGDLEILGGAELCGSGSVTATNTFVQGVVCAGNSPGHLTINGNLILEEGSVLEIEIAGTEQGVSYDFIDVTGDFIMNGTLELVFLDGFIPDIGNVFDFINVGGNISGAFDEIIVPTGAGVSMDFAFNDTNDGFNFSTEQIPTPGALLLFLVGFAGFGWSRRKLTLNELKATTT